MYVSLNTSNLNYQLRRIQGGGDFPSVLKTDLEVMVGKGDEIYK